MYSHSGRDDNNNRIAKQIPAIDMTGIIVAAALLMSGGVVFAVGSYQQTASAQQNVTGGNATSTTGGGAGAESPSACSPLQTEGGGAAEGTNATSTRGAQSTDSEVRVHIEEACTAIQNNDTQGALMHLN
ncbi:MAG: hypothetical protein M3232_00700, partial [Thermoproteota archaeon]|nr:hypothetical protein [Thermoproteota archaeon]